MELRKFTILPAAIALSLMMAPVALAGADKAHSGDEHRDRDKGRGDGDRDKPRGGGDRHNPRDGKQGPPGPPGPAGRDGRDSNVNISGGGGGDLSRNFTCRVQNRKFYVATQGECNELKISFGVYVGGGHGYGHVRKTRRSQGYMTGGGYVHGGNVVVGGGYATGGGYGYYQPHRVIRYVAQPSPAARKQMERRARKAARLAAEQAAAYGYAQGGMVGYGNGVMVGGYGNNVMIHGDVYGGAGYAQGGYGYGEQVVVRKKRKGKKARRMIIQQPGLVYGDGYVYGGAYGYNGPVMVKGGGY